MSDPVNGLTPAKIFLGSVLSLVVLAALSFWSGMQEAGHPSSEPVRPETSVEGSCEGPPPGYADSISARVVSLTVGALPSQVRLTIQLQNDGSRTTRALRGGILLTDIYGSELVGLRLDYPDALGALQTTTVEYVVEDRVGFPYGLVGRLDELGPENLRSDATWYQLVWPDGTKAMIWPQNESEDCVMEQILWAGTLGWDSDIPVLGLRRLR